MRDLWGLGLYVRELGVSIMKGKVVQQAGAKSRGAKGARTAKKYFSVKVHLSVTVIIIMRLDLRMIVDITVTLDPRMTMNIPVIMCTMALMNISMPVVLGVVMRVSLMDLPEIRLIKMISRVMKLFIREYCAGQALLKTRVGQSHGHPSSL